jgi:D-alanyl-D-alanine carboxypeptidase
VVPRESEQPGGENPYKQMSSERFEARLMKATTYFRYELALSGFILLAIASLLSSIAAMSRESSLGVFSITPALCAEMRSRHVINSGAPVGCDRLRLVRFDYVGFDGLLHDDGEIMVMDAVADQVLQLFAALRNLEFRIEKAQLIDRYDGDDDRSMADNNTSAFNHRKVLGTRSLSMHAYGVAVDINPRQNPYVERTPQGRAAIFPPAAVKYLDRSRYPAEQRLRLGLAEAAIDVFADHGFAVWGGHWRNPDYQHFQVSRSLAAALVRLNAHDAAALFERHVEVFRRCRIQGRSRAACAAANEQLR